MGRVKRESVKEAVIDLRRQLNLNQSDFGAKMGVSPMTVSRWEAGTNDPPAECMVKMAVLSGNATVFWKFMNHIGLSKKDLKNYR